LLTHVYHLKFTILITISDVFNIIKLI